MAMLNNGTFPVFETEKEWMPRPPQDGFSVHLIHTLPPHRAFDPHRSFQSILKRSETIWNDLKHCLTAGAKTLDCLDCSKVHMAGDFILSLCQDRAWLGAWWRIFFCRRKRYPPQQVWDKVDQGSSTLVKTCQNHPESETALRRMSCSLQPGSTKRNCRWRLRSCMQSSEDMRFFIVEASIVQCYFVGN